MAPNGRSAYGAGISPVRIFMAWKPPVTNGLRKSYDTTSASSANPAATCREAYRSARLADTQACE